jgi:hypothetical protein
MDHGRVDVEGCWSSTKPPAHGSRSRTRRTASYLVEVAPESDPVALVASFQAMAYRTDRWHLGPGDWSAEWKAEH